MMGDLSILAVGLVIGVAIAWVLPGLPQRPHSVGARAAPRAEKPAGKPDSGARPKNDQLSLQQDVRGCDPPVGKHPFEKKPGSFPGMTNTLHTIPTLTRVPERGPLGYRGSIFSRVRASEHLSAGSFRS